MFDQDIFRIRMNLKRVLMGAVILFIFDSKEPSSKLGPGESTNKAARRLPGIIVLFVFHPRILESPHSRPWGILSIGK